MFFLNLTMLFLAAWLGLSHLPGAVLPAEAAGSRLVHEELTSPALAANLLNDPEGRALTVYLPPQYDREPGRRFPVVYLLHGFKAKNRLWTDAAAPGQGLNLQQLADELIRRKVIQPVIIVMPDGSNAYGGSFYLNSAVTGNWEDFICRDLVGHMDNTYRTIPQPQARGLAGHSMGGYGAFLLGMRHPDIFGAVYALSPACLVFENHFLELQRANLLAVAKLDCRDKFADLTWRDQVIIAAGAAVAPNPTNPPWLFDLPLKQMDGREVLDEAIWQKWLQSDPFTLLEPHKANLARLRLAFDMGTADRLLPQTRLVNQALEKLEIVHTYEEYQGDHASHMRERLKDRALPFLFGVQQKK